MKPFISLICVTYARIAHLEEAIASFVRQDYDGESEMLVLNTCPEQTLTLGNGYENVRIINLSERPASLGDARNFAVSQADGTHIAILDDDDLLLPEHLSTIAKSFAPELEWAWLDKQFFAERWRIAKIVPGTCNVFCYTKSLWEKVGGYPALSCGEDRAFVNKAAAAGAGLKAQLANDEITSIYCWDNDAFHISGKGDKGGAGSYAQVAENTRRGIRNGSIPSGEVALQPAWKYDYCRMAQDFIAHLPEAKAHNGNVCIVQLGRFGDIINMLPIAKCVHDNYDTPALMVSKEFAAILDGVSYVIPYVVDLKNHELGAALRLAKAKFKRVIQTQSWGTDLVLPPRQTQSYNVESWHNAGFGHKFNDKSMLPVFDRRDAKRESDLIANLVKTEKPLLLVNLTHSVSSPFDGKELLKLVHARYDDACEVIDLGALKVHRVFDLLGLLEMANAVVSIDSMLLHLAAATAVPTVAVVNPKPWLGTVCRGNLVGQMDYDTAPRHPDVLLSKIDVAINHE